MHSAFSIQAVLNSMCKRSVAFDLSTLWMVKRRTVRYMC